MKEHRYHKASRCSEYENITARWMSAVDIWLEHRTQSRRMNSGHCGLEEAKKLAREAADIYLERLEHTLSCKGCQSRVPHAELHEDQQR
jgi:hypothetical protein